MRPLVSRPPHHRPPAAGAHRLTCDAIGRPLLAANLRHTAKLTRIISSVLLKFQPMIQPIEGDHPLPPDLVATVIDVIQAAYRENAPLQVPALGHGNWTFALTNVETIKYFLRERGGDVVQTEGNSLRLEVDGRRYYIHKLGRSERDDPWVSFPNSAGPAGRAAENQHQLRFDFDGLDEPELLIWVIGHYGTLEDGVRAIRLQASGAADDGRIRSWVRVVDLWIADDADGTGRVAGPTPVGPPAVDVEEPRLMPKRQEVADEADPDAR
jgi:hypothetical protein